MGARDVISVDAFCGTALYVGDERDNLNAPIFPLMFFVAVLLGNRRWRKWIEA